MADTKFTLPNNSADDLSKGNIPIKAQDLGDGTFAIATTEQPAQPVNSTPSTSTPVSADGSLSLLAGERAFLQNCGTTPIYVKLGAGASSTSFHLILSAGDIDDDGQGATLEWGPISEPLEISFAFGTGPSKRATAWKV